MLTDLLGTRSLFGCNLCILFGISLLVIIILMFIWLFIIFTHFANIQGQPCLIKTMLLKIIKRTLKFMLYFKGAQTRRITCSVNEVLRLIKNRNYRGKMIITSLRWTKLPLILTSIMITKMRLFMMFFVLKETFLIKKKAKGPKAWKNKFQSSKLYWSWRKNCHNQQPLKAKSTGSNYFRRK